jgi:hypothetical protein
MSVPSACTIRSGRSGIRTSNVDIAALLMKRRRTVSPALNSAVQFAAGGWPLIRKV